MTPPFRGLKPPPEKGQIHAFSPCYFYIFFLDWYKTLGLVLFEGYLVVVFVIIRNRWQWPPGVPPGAPKWPLKEKNSENHLNNELFFAYSLSRCWRFVFYVKIPSSSGGVHKQSLGAPQGGSFGGPKKGKMAKNDQKLDIFEFFQKSKQMEGRRICLDTVL